MAQALSSISPTISCAPAGTTYNSIQDGGRNTLKLYCDGYPNTPNSYIVPPLFASQFPELPVPKQGLTSREENKFRGMVINQTGEQAEKSVYDIFQRLIRQDKNVTPLLLLRNFNIDNDNQKNLKRNALQSELPTIDLSQTNTTGEQDGLALLKDLGIVLVEIKSSSRVDNITKAESQLANSDRFVQSLAAAISGSTSTAFPTSKLIIIPGEINPSPSTPTQHGSHVVYKDLCETFETKWSQIISELQHIKSTNQFTYEDFEQLAELLMGVWTSKAICVSSMPRTFKLYQDDADASLTEQIKHIDALLDTAVLRNEKKMKSVAEMENCLTQILRTKRTEIFQACNGIKFVYLTPLQKQVYDYCMHAIIRGPAGTGKTLLMLFKVMELMKNHPNQQILILAPHPHHLRCKNILETNGIKVDVTTDFPIRPLEDTDLKEREVNQLFDTAPTPTPTITITTPPPPPPLTPPPPRTTLPPPTTPPPTSPPLPPTPLPTTTPPPTSTLATPPMNGTVAIMKLDDFFDVGREKLLSYDLSGHHIFVDDLQNFRGNYRSNNAKYLDIGDFVEQTFVTSQVNKLYCWVALDVLQGDLGSDSGSRDYSPGLFLTPNGQPRTYSIPIVTLEHTLRNSEDVTKLVVEARNKRKTDTGTRVPLVGLPNIQIGHKLCSQLVSYHKLLKGSKEKYHEAFVLERIHDELTKITTPPNSFELSQVAIIWEWKPDFGKYKANLNNLLLTKFNTIPQTITEQLLSGNNDDIIVDVCENVMSFETSCVIFIRRLFRAPPPPGRDYEIYNSFSRARTILTVIDARTDKDPLPYKNMDIITWGARKNKFYITHDQPEDNSTSEESDNESDTDIKIASETRESDNGSATANENPNLIADESDNAHENVSVTVELHDDSDNDTEERDDESDTNVHSDSEESDSWL